jgi:hypothetical protein
MSAFDIFSLFKVTTVKYDSFNLLPGPFFLLAYKKLRPFPRYARDVLLKIVGPYLNLLHV